MKQNKKLENISNTALFLKSAAKSLVNDSVKGIHRFDISYQSDCGIFIGGILNNTILIILELELFYENIQAPMNDHDPYPMMEQ